MNLQRLLFLFAMAAAIAALSACATSIRWADPANYTLTIVDNPAQKRFDLVLAVQEAETLCLTREQWPSRVGQLHMGGGAEVASKGIMMSARKDNFGYCPGGCGEHRITASSPLKGFIAYDAFAEAQALALDADKKLTYQAHPYICPPR